MTEMFAIAKKPALSARARLIQGAPPPGEWRVDSKFCNDLVISRTPLANRAAVANDIRAAEIFERRWKMSMRLNSQRCARIVRNTPAPSSARALRPNEANL
jgi:hypothetical protein